MEIPSSLKLSLSGHIPESTTPIITSLPKFETDHRLVLGLGEMNSGVWVVSSVTIWSL
jgi:hypothetical protein